MASTQATHARRELDEYQALAPGVADGIRAIGAAVKSAEPDPELLELVKIRASQLNGCAYCLQLHLNIARKLGVAPEKVDLLATWPEAGIYSERELAAFAWTELVTRIPHGGIPDEAYAAIHEQFSEAEVAILTAAIIEINAWNRLGTIYRFTPSIPRRGGE